MNSPRYTLAAAVSPQLIKVIISFFFQWLRHVHLLTQQTASVESCPSTKSTSSSSSNNHKQALFTRYPLFASPIPEFTSIDDSRASYDNIFKYCLKSSLENDSVYAKFDFRHLSLPITADEQKFEERCANYDNLSYLVADGKASRRDRSVVNKIASCKDYFAATTGFVAQENGQGKSIDVYGMSAHALNRSRTETKRNSVFF